MASTQVYTYDGLACYSHRFVLTARIFPSCCRLQSDSWVRPVCATEYVSVLVRLTQRAGVADPAIVKYVNYVADAALEPLSPGEEFGARGTELNCTACELQPDDSPEHFPESPDLLDNESKVRHGAAKGGSSAWGRAWCLRLGMSASSWDGWAQLHVNPCVAIRYFFSSFVLYSSTAAYMCTGVRGEGHMYFVVVVPVASHTVLCLAIAVMFWRWGPTVALHKLYQPVPALLTLCLLPLAYATFLGPAATVPWHNSFHSISVVCFGSFWQLQLGAAGFLPGEHPAEPRTSIREPLLRNTVQALMSFDALTDLELSKSLLAAVCYH